MTSISAAQIVKPEALGDIKLSEIHIGHRYREDMGDIDTLMESIKQNGLISPIAVCRIDPPSGALTKVMKVGAEEFKYSLLAGGRRCEAYKRLELETIAANIYPSNIGSLERRIIELAENIDRKDMTYEEQVFLTQQIHLAMQEMLGKARVMGTEKTGHSMSDTATMLGRSKASVSQDLQLAEAIKALPELGKAKNKHEAVKMLKGLIKQETIREAAELVQSKKAETGDEKHRRKLINSYILGDFFEGIASVGDRSIDCFDVDTPFAIALTDCKKGGSTDEYNEWAIEEFQSLCQRVLNEAYRVLKPTGWLFWWFAYDPWFDTIANMIEGTGFLMNRIPAIWVKPNGQTNRPEMYMASSHEPMFYARRSQAATILRPGRANHFQFSPVPPQRKIHPTEKPIIMLSHIYDTFLSPGSQIVVPFLGSGNNILAADNTGCSALGWDLTKEYKDRYTVRVMENTAEVFV